MCLIINKPAKVEFSDQWLRDFWRTNRDGAGIMWHNGEAVEVVKITSPSEDEWVDFYNENARGRKCVIHLRMRTHGAINEENTHPYVVSRGYHLMHNGVLATGNSADRSKSDTWHFIKNVLRPALRNDRTCLDKPEVLKAIGERIGRSNRFVILGAHGPKIVNSESGVMWRGAWFSNTYAWSAPLISDAHLSETAVSPVRSKIVIRPQRGWSM